MRNNIYSSLDELNQAVNDAGSLIGVLGLHDYQFSEVDYSKIGTDKNFYGKDDAWRKE